MTTQGIVADPDIMMGKPVVVALREHGAEMQSAFAVVTPGLVRVRPRL